MTLSACLYLLYDRSIAILVGKNSHKSSRGQGEIHDEPKSERQLALLTPTAHKWLRIIADKKGLSLSETIEQLIRDYFNKSEER